MTTLRKLLLAGIIAVHSLATVSAMEETFKRLNVGQEDNSNFDEDEELRRALELSAREVEAHEMRLNQEQAELEKVLALSVEKANVRQNELDNKLLEVIQTGGLNEVESLLNEGADVNVQSEDGITPLHWATRSGDHRKVKLLIEKGAKVNAQTKLGVTPLMWASSTGLEPVLKLLLEKDADVSAQERDGTTSLMRAILISLPFFSLEGTKLLIDNGAPFNVLNNDMDSALCLAVKKGSAVLVNEILRNPVLRCLSKEMTNEYRKRFKEALLCMNRKKTECFAKDLWFMILLGNSELEKEFVHILYYDLCNGYSVGKWFNLLCTKLYDYTIEELKVFMDRAGKKVTDDNHDLTKLLDSTLLEENFGEVIRTNMQKRLNLLKQKANKVDVLN